MALSLSKKICELLLSKNLVSEEDLIKARDICSKQGGSLSDILVSLGAVTKDDLLTTVSEGLGFPVIKLSLFRIDDDLLRLIPKKVAMSYQILPVSRISKRLTVAMVDPLNILALDDLKTITNMDVNPVLAAEEDMREALIRYYEKSADEEISAIVDDMESASMEMIDEKQQEMSSVDLLRITEDAPVVKLANMVLSHAVKERASDVLIEPMEGNSRVRYRIDGVLASRYNPPKKYHQAIISRLKVMANMDIAERRLPQDGRFRIRVEDRRIDFRVSIVPSSYGEKAALRVLDKEQARIDLDMLGLMERDRKVIRECSEKPHGMILMCGPTGCGKTTTLYSILKHLDDPSKNLITVEDPVEYELKGINQVSINDEIGLTFAGCLRSILRQDPDIVMVGEIRDYDTIDVAIKAALTGHMVLSTLHTNTASGSVVRMINMGVEPFLIASSIVLIAAQRLLRKLCSECKKPYIPPMDVAEKYGLLDDKGAPIRIFQPVGCQRCFGIGYMGRLGIIECLRITEAVKELVFKRAQEGEIERMAQQEGMKTLRENGIENVRAGVASLEDVLRTTL